MRRPSAPLLGLVLALAAPLHAEDEPGPVRLGGVLETRVAHTGGTLGWLDGGMGKTRYGALEGDPATVFSLSQASLLLDAEAGEVLSVHLQANLDTEQDAGATRARVGLVEAYGAWKPDLLSWLRLRTKAGLFFPPVSLEHRGPAWTTTHTLTPSAINSWIGEEVRAVGAEARAVFVVRDHEVSAVGAAFGSNDPAGTLLHWRGWALHDRQTATGDELPLPPIPAILPGGIFPSQAEWDAPIREIDGRVGWYAGASWRVQGVFEASALRWDNRADPSAFDGYQYGWYTEFDVYSGRVVLPLGLEVMAQHLAGETTMGYEYRGRYPAHSEFQSTYGLLSGTWGRLRLSGRYDDFQVRDLDPNTARDPNDEDGEAWTVAAIVRLGERHQLIGEWLRVESSRPARATIGEPVDAREDLVQLALRLHF